MPDVSGFVPGAFATDPSERDLLRKLGCKCKVFVDEARPDIQRRYADESSDGENAEW